MLRLLLITASSPEIRRVRRSRFLNFQQITMPYLAARVPPGWDVRHVDEGAEAIDWDSPVDVAGITFHTPSAPHAYEIADRFRARGVCVVLGGPHVTLLPDEARRHADAIFVGEAEGLWETFLRDFGPAFLTRRPAPPISGPAVLSTGAPRLPHWPTFRWPGKTSSTGEIIPPASFLPPGAARTVATSVRSR